MSIKEHDASKGDDARRPAVSWRRLLPLGVLVAGLAAFFLFGLNDYLTFDTLRDHRAWLLQQVSESLLLASLVFIAIYVTVVAFSLPGGAVMTIAGGFLFGQVLGTVYVVIAATIGATILFLAARSALGDFLRAKAGPFLKKMEAGFQENALSYLLVLRLVPIFPFFIVNLVPAFLGVGLRTYVIATFLGIIPGSLVYASFGAGIGTLLDAGEELSPRAILGPEVITALIGLAILALLPVGYKKLKAKRGR